GQVSLGLAARELLDGEEPKQCVAALPEEDLPALHPSHGVDFLVDTIMAGAGDIVPVTIGAMTNLAMALVKEPRLLRKIPRVVSMCGCFESERTEWNISCDPVAAGIVFGSGVPMTVVGLDVTLQVVLTEDERARVLSSDRPVARCLTEATRAWERRMPVLHDPLAVETLIKPELVSTRRGSVTVELAGGDTYGRTTFAPDDSGPHAVGHSVRADEAKSLWLERVLAL
ncbi:MAG: nucleoside hydrolase, partial [Planctomycetota bacterium]